MGRWWISFVVLVSCLSLPWPARSEPPPTTDGSETPSTERTRSERLERAKALFQRGNLLRKSGDCARAVDFYDRSRELVASAANTLNAAICLDQLGRLDEALARYEQLLVDFSSSLDEENRRALAPQLNRLRRAIGSLDIVSNASGQLVIDGRPRGTLPLLSPVRVMPGQHTVSILAEGFVPFTTRVDVAVGQTVQVSANLKVLANAGTVRIDDDSLQGAKIFIDGAQVATAPWRGRLSVGRYIVFLQRDDKGSGPQVLSIVDRRTTRLAPALSPLGPSRRFLVEPSSATLQIDGVTIGKGQWQGRLPNGEHTISVSEPGYRTSSKRINFNDAMSEDIRIALELDPTHPRWRKARTPGTIWLEVSGGAGLTPSLGSSADRSCENSPCSLNERALGWSLAARVLYEWPGGFGAHAGLDAMDIGKNVRRTVQQTSGSNLASYSLGDSLRFQGNRLQLGLSYHHSLTQGLSLRVLGSVGGVWARSRQFTAGHVTLGNQRALATVQGSGQWRNSLALSLAPEMQLLTRLGPVTAGIGLAADIFVLEGASSYESDGNASGELLVVASDECGAGARIGCLPGSTALSDEKTYGSFVLWRPAASVSYRF